MDPSVQKVQIFGSRHTQLQGYRPKSDFWGLQRHVAPQASPKITFWSVVLQFPL